MATVGDIARVLEAWAPRATAQSYDNVGLQIGRLERVVERVLVALDVTPEVVEEAVRIRADLIVTHHPLLFKPLRTLTSRSLVSGLALRIAEEGIALFAAHTNLDAAPEGVSFALASALGLEDIEFLTRLEGSLFKLVTFVPESHEDAVREALAAAGAGQIGDYDSCAFAVRGTGHFRPGPGADPYIGAVDGTVQSAEEVRVEVEVPRWYLDEALGAMKAAHPYEEVAYDVYPVEQRFSGAGLGAVGNLEAPLQPEDFLDRVSAALDVPAVRYAGPVRKPVSRVAVCGGAGADLMGAARRAGAQAFVTSDLSYHRFFEVMDERGVADLLLIDAGHYETEAPIEAIIAEHLSTSVAGVDFRRTEIRTSPIRYHVR